LPVTAASDECSFSSLKLIKTDLRLTKGNYWLSDLLVISAVSDITARISLYDAVDIYIFKNKK
jgi:hypothetical protein